jgi:hypothetical protein
VSRLILQIRIWNCQVLLVAEGHDECSHAVCTGQDYLIHYSLLESKKEKRKIKEYKTKKRKDLHMKGKPHCITSHKIITVIHTAMRTSHVSYICLRHGSLNINSTLAFFTLLIHTYSQILIF